MGVCKVLASFETNARGTLNTNCGPCHRGQVATATAVLNLTGIDAPNAMNACNEVLLHVNLTDVNQSAIFVTTMPGGGNHPFQFGGNTASWDAFRITVTPWINAERDAP